MWTWIITTQVDFLHTWLNRIPNMLETASNVLTNDYITVVILIGLVVWFLIAISK